MENPLHVSTIRGTLLCEFCGLSQFERGNGICRRCRHPLGVAYLELLPSIPLDSSSSRSQIAIRKTLGGLIRRLRSRRGITQTALASLTGINRTYVSRAERGQVMPSVIALLKIGGALGIDKILLRLRTGSTQS
jgi:DNA-binding XRE family transcriptional regulator